MRCPLVARRVLLTVALFCTGIIAGCGDGSPRTVPVSGTITFGGGEWPAAGSLFFMVVESADGFPKKSGSAEFDKDGRFVAKTFADGDGLIPGRYLVGVNCWAEPYEMGGPPQKSHVPGQYRDASTSGFEVEIDVRPSDDVSLEFDVPRN
jgi:hypothetical protein